MPREIEIDMMPEFGILHTADKHPMAYATRFYKGVCGYCEPEKCNELIAGDGTGQPIKE